MMTPMPTCCRLVGIVLSGTPCPRRHQNRWDTDPAATGNTAGEKHSLPLLGEDKKN